MERREIRIGGGQVLPVLTVKGGPGPSAVVAANLHGDECIGIAVVHALAERVGSLDFRGTLTLLPTLNPAGLRAQTRGHPDDELDPNRAFPGRPRGSPARVLAHHVWSLLVSLDPSVVVDLHTDARASIPYAIVDRVVRGERRAGLEGRCLALAEASGLTVLREYPADRYLRYGLDRSLPGALVNGPGVAAVTLEVGPRRDIDPDAVDDALAASLGVLTGAGLVDQGAPVHQTRRSGGPWRRESGPRATRPGVLVPLVRPGADLVRGTPLAEVRTLSGEVLEVLDAPGDGFVVALPERAWVEVGATCATLATRDEG